MAPRQRISNHATIDLISIILMHFHVINFGVKTIKKMEVTLILIYCILMVIFH